MTDCSECGKKLRSSQVRKNYPFGKKSKPRKTGLCYRCKHPEEAKKMDEALNRAFDSHTKQEVRNG